MTGRATADTEPADLVPLYEETTAGATERLRFIRQRFLTRWLDALQTFHASDAAAKAATLTAAEVTAARQTATATLASEWHAAIDEAFPAAHAAGRSIWTSTAPGAESASDGLQHLMRTQKRFATRFAVDVAQGKTEKPGRQKAAVRTEMYANAVEAAYQQGSLDAVPPGYLIEWRLGGEGRHCWQCPLIAANGPFTRETMPSFPRAGATPCGSRCLCFLEYRRADTKPKPPTDEERAEETQRARPIVDRVLGEAPAPPPGKRRPTGEERRVLHDLETRLNRARRVAQRAADSGRDTARDKALALRSKLNERLIQFTKERGIHHVPTWSVGDVIRGRELRARDVDNLTHVRGLDGTTIHRAQAAAIKQALKAAHADMQELLGSLPADLPGVPDFDELLRAAGAPAAGGRLSRLVQSGPAPVWDLLESVDDDDPLPSPAGEVVCNLVGRSSAASLQAHLAAVALLAEQPFALELGPLDDDWMPLVAAVGTWVRGEGAEVARLLTALAPTRRRYGLEVATWQP